MTSRRRSGRALRTFGMLAVVIARTVYAHDDGIVGRVQAGCTCHGPSPTPSVTVTITGPTAMPAHAVNTFLVAVAGGPGFGGGFDARVVDGSGNQAGTISVRDDANTRIEAGEITHTNPFLAGVAAQLAGARYARRLLLPGGGEFGQSRRHPQRGRLELRDAPRRHRGAVPRGYDAAVRQRRRRVSSGDPDVHRRRLGRLRRRYRTEPRAL